MAGPLDELIGTGVLYKRVRHLFNTFDKEKLRSAMSGNREALLVAAKHCLLARGFARTTARDIAAAAGVSLAAIGYHFGTKENLLTAALLSAIEELQRELGIAADNQSSASLTPRERFESGLSRLIDSFATHRRLWAANLEIFAEVERIPELRSMIDDGLLQNARASFVALFDGRDVESVDDRSIRTTGSLYYALVTGILVQWIVDPKHAPSAKELTEALGSLLL